VLPPARETEKGAGLVGRGVGVGVTLAEMKIGGSAEEGADLALVAATMDFMTPNNVARRAVAVAVDKTMASGESV